MSQPPGIRWNLRKRATAVAFRLVTLRPSQRRGSVCGYSPLVSLLEAASGVAVGVVVAGSVRYGFFS